MHQPNCQVEYQYNGVPNLFEFYLFVNPLGSLCYQCEQEISKVVKAISTSTDVYILPYHNQTTVKEFMERLSIPGNDLNQRNDFYRKVYHACLAFKAASMQGQRNGRRYLMSLQSHLMGKASLYNRPLAIKLAKELNLDVETFVQDLESDFVRKLYMRDQKIAKEMQISQTPTLIIRELQSNNIETLVKEEITLHQILNQTDMMVADHIASLKDREHTPNQRKTKLQILRNHR